MACGYRIAAIVACVVLAMSVDAGIKYWDNPAFRAFDVGDYAPGAVWHFDGIRNVGADQPHSTTTTTWKNIGTTGSSNDVWIRYLNAAGSGWANSSAPASLGIVNGRNLGSWTENGFVFTGDSEWRAASPASTGRSRWIPPAAAGVADRSKPRKRVCGSAMGSQTSGWEMICTRPISSTTCRTTGITAAKGL